MAIFKVSTIRARMLISFVLMTLLPTIAVGAGAATVGYYTGQQQAIDRLESVAARKELAIEGWLRSVQQELVVVSNTEGEHERISIVLDLSREDKYYDFYSKAVRSRLQRFVSQSRLLQQLFLVDLRGRVILSTDTALEGHDLSSQPCFQRGLQGSYVQLPFYSDRSETVAPPPLDGTSVVVAIPIVGRDGLPLGVLAGRASIGALQQLLREQTGLGSTGKTFLLNSDYALLAGSQLEPADPKQPGEVLRFMHNPALTAAVASRTNGNGVYRDYRQVPVIGVHRWLPELGAMLVAEQDLTEAARAVYTTLAVILAIGLIAVLFAIVASLFSTRSIATPLVNLVTTATQIAAGDLDRVARVERDDEIGALAKAFNRMTALLRELINDLERRVQERTRALQQANQVLQQQALRLETSVRVSREITSILEIDDLMAQVVKLIREAFGYYDVQVFLIDRRANQLVLSSRSNGLPRQFERLDIGQQSLNAQAVQTGQPQIVNDVMQDPHYLHDERLPNTRSELVVPLRLGEQIIGTLDVLSAEVNAFSSEDVLVIQGLADQIAIAIDNARLYDRSRELAILEERTRLARELHDSVTQSLYSLVLLSEGWRRLAGSGEKVDVDDYLGRVGAIAQEALKEMRLLIHELRPPALQEEGLLGALYHRLEAVEKRAGIDARLLVDDLLDLPAHVEEGLYRLAQEALNNALKHGSATAVTVHVRAEGGHVVLEVMDNGRGFDPETAARSGGMGLANMRERARQLGASLSILSAPGQGTTIRVSVIAGGNGPNLPPRCS